jgi:hypothetical protein
MKEFTYEFSVILKQIMGNSYGKRKPTESEYIQAKMLYDDFIEKHRKNLF